MADGFPAQYTGRCEDCGAGIHVGDRIRQVDHTGDRRYAHVTCPDDARLSIRPGEQVCSSCFLLHPAGACDT